MNLTESQNIPLSVDTHCINLLNAEQARHYNVIPFAQENGSIAYYATKGQYDAAVKDELEIVTGKQPVFEFISEDALMRLFARYYPTNSSTNKSFSSNNTDDFLPKIIEEAQKINSSDIHIEVYDECARVRFRIDGKLVERYSIDKLTYPAFINKVKVMAHLDIAEKRLPQDGRIMYRSENEEFDIRVSSLPTIFGEKIVLRLLSKEVSTFELEELGFTPTQYKEYYKSINRPNGIILISGPTGSGKTTTLYSTLKVLNKEDTNILTVEDPVEYTIEGVNQVQIKESIGYTYAKALRTFLRQDPDIIMLGEIRDAESAQMAIRASLTGHLVFSTIHTNSAWGTISRLIDMGIPAYMVANTMNISLAQRLIRVLCPHCKKEEPLTADYSIIEIKENIQKHHVPVGCKACFYTGYKGRKAIYEAIPFDEALRGIVKSGELNRDEYYRQHNVACLADIALKLFRKGETSLEEIIPYLVSR